MAEFQEVMREWVRSRKAINANKLSCCPLETFTDDYIANIEKKVMSWAADHPEPVYPTWREYLESIKVIAPRKNYTVMDTYSLIISQIDTTPIPASIAEKLGLEPKEKI